MGIPNFRMSRLERRIKDWVSVTDHGVTTAAMNAAIQEAYTEGKKLVFPKRNGAVYPLTTTFGATLNAADLHLVFEDCPTFEVQSGFAAGIKAFQFIPQNGARLRFEGDLRIDVQNQPQSGVGQANDAFSVNGDGTGRCFIDYVEVYHGSDVPANNGGDSSFFFGYLKECVIDTLRGEGPPDAIFYLSGGSGSTSEVMSDMFIDKLIGKNAPIGLIPKRYFKNFQIGRLNFELVESACVIGGEANIGASSQVVNAQNIQIGQLIGHQCGSTLILRYARRVSVDSVIATEIGHPTNVTRCQAILLAGAQDCHVKSLHVSGTNPDATGVTDFCGVTVTSRTNDEGTRNSTDNVIGPMWLEDITRPVRELTTSQDRNSYIIAMLRNVSGANVLNGSQCGVSYPSGPWTVTVADDGFTSFDIPAGKSCLVSVVTNSNTAPSLNGTFKITGTTSVSNIGLASTTNVTFTTGALNGTTGTDGNVIVSIHTDNKLYIENRRGVSLTFTVQLLAIQ